MIIIFYISLFLYIVTLSIFTNVVDFDLWARLVVGKTFFQTGKLLNFDFQSFGPTRQWFDHEWGSSLVFYQITDKFGDFGLIIFKAVMIFITFFIFTRIILLRRNHRAKNTGADNSALASTNAFLTAPFNIIFFILLTQAVLDIVFTTVRCNLFTFLFFAIWLYALEKTRLEQNFRLLWIIPTTMIIWANMHGGCFVGLGLIFLYALGEFLNKKKFIPYLVVLALSLCAMFINPYGIKYVYFLFHAITLKRSSITEWQPIFHKIHMFKFLKFKLWACAVAVISGIFLFKKYSTAVEKTGNTDARFFDKIKALYNSLDKTKALILIVMFLMSLKTLRLTPFFTFSAAVFLYDDIYKVLNKKLPNTLNNAKEILMFVLILISFVFTIKTMPIQTTVAGYPYVEAEFLRINKLKGNLLADFHYGSYLAYRLHPNIYIFMDGRYEETYEPGLLERLKAIHIGKNWKDEINKQHIDFIIAEKRYPLYERLLDDKDWKLYAHSKQFSLFLNKDVKLKSYKNPPLDFNYYNKDKWQTKIDWSIE